MTRLIDETKPLSDEDRDFLMRNGQENRVYRLDAAHGVDTAQVPPFLTGNEPALQGGPPPGVLNAPGVVPAALASNVGGNSILHGIPTEQLEEYLRERKAAESGAGTDNDTDDYSTEHMVESEDYRYEDWTAAQLKAQLGYRELSKSGTKPEMAQRLRDNDAA